VKGLMALGSLRKRDEPMDTKEKAVGFTEGVAWAPRWRQDRCQGRT
jgi:hypothetical protein